MKKICLISDRNPYMQRFCRLLSEKGYEIALICRHQGGISRDLFPQNMTFYQLSSTSLRVKYTEIRAFIRKFEPDIVHLHYLAKDSIIPALRWPRPYRYLISAWGSDINIDSKKWLNRIVQYLALHLCDRIHLLSSYFETKIRQLYPFLNPKKIRLFSWGVDYDFLSQPASGKAGLLRKEFNIGINDPVILSYRNHKEIYNHHTLLRAAPAVLKIFPRTKFVFTRSSFDPVYLEKTRQLVQNLALNDNFIFIDRWLSDPELHDLRQLAACIVNIPFEDGLPATLFEIMATRAVPIVGELESYQPFFKTGINGFTLKNLTDHGHLSEIIIKILSGPENYIRKFCQTNNEYIKAEQNWRKQSALFLDFYTA